MPVTRLIQAALAGEADHIVAPKKKTVPHSAHSAAFPHWERR
jgi:hypothetical protein